MVERDGRAGYDLDGIAAAFDRGAGLFVHVNPHNPLGRVFDVEEQLALAEVVSAAGARVFADEIHAPLVYPGAVHRPYASLTPETARHTVTATSTSKAWNVPGLKTAQLILSNAEDAEHWADVGNLFGHGASTPGLAAAAAAYDEGEGWLDDVLAYLDGNRRLLGDAARRATARDPLHRTGGHVPRLAGLPPTGPGGVGRCILPGAGRRRAGRRPRVRGTGSRSRAAELRDTPPGADRDRGPHGRRPGRPLTPHPGRECGSSGEL